MQKLLLNIITCFMIFTVLLAACSKDNDPVGPTVIIPDENINGPNEEDYDFYIAMSYSGPQPVNPLLKHYYILIACEDSAQGFQSLEMKIQDTPINLEYADYGEIFYIAYFDLAPADIYNFKFTINGKCVETDLTMIDELNIELPVTLEASRDVPLNWVTAKNPDVTYIEGFQKNSNEELLDKKVKNFEPVTRSFIMPASWLWSEEETTKREIQVGIMNYKIVDRVCFTISDGAYKAYH